MIFFCFRQEAREIIRTAVNATDDEAVVFCGHGCIDALNKLIWALDIRDTPVIFTGPSEHRENLTLWQKTGAKVSFFFIPKLALNFLVNECCLQTSSSSNFKMLEQLPKNRGHKSY